MICIRFNRAEVYETEGPGRGVRYCEGQVVTLRDDLAMRWIQRGAAHIHEQPALDLDGSSSPEIAIDATARASKKRARRVPVAHQSTGSNE